MRASITKALLLGSVLWASAAMAEPDPFGLGNGGTPPVGGTPLLVNGTGQPSANRYARIATDVVVGADEVRVHTSETDTNAWFPNGRMVMVIQMGSVTPAAPNADLSPEVVLNNSNGIGRWELARVRGRRYASGNSFIQLQSRLTRAYPGEVSQVVAVPEYNSVLFSGTNPSLIAGQAWDAGTKTGGVLALLVDGPITMSAGSSFDVSGQGLKGAPYRNGADDDECPETQTGTLAALRGQGIYLDNFSVGEGGWNAANGGGGGVCRRSGGGGGGNVGPGGKGGFAEDGSQRDVGGRGGVRLSYTRGSSNPPFVGERLTLGGGGGGGHGTVPIAQNPNADAGAGGGIIFIRAASLVLNGSGSTSILASGSPGGPSASEGAAGGGAGGTIYVRLAGGASMCPTIAANGGAGGNQTNNATPTPKVLAPGGGGGGGRVLFQAESWPLACAPTANAGLAGIAHGGVAYGATPTSATASDHAGEVILKQEKFTEPAMPIVFSPATGSFTSSTSVPVSGITRPGASVELFLGTTNQQTVHQQAAATVQESGLFTGTLTVSTPDGPYGVWARATYLDAQGDPSNPANTFTLDRDPPSLDVDGPPSDTRERGATFTFSSDEDPLVTYRCRLVETPTTSFETCLTPYRLTMPDGDATYRLEVQAFDKALNPSSVVPYEWRVDSVPPTPPIFTAPQMTSPVSLEGRPTVSGSALGAVTVDLYLIDVAGGPAQSWHENVVVGNDGNWTWRPQVGAGLDDGDYWVTATAEDAVGNVSGYALSRPFSVDTAEPAAPVITRPTPRETFPSETPTIQGTAEPGSTVHVTVNDGTMGEINVVAPLTDGGGRWSVTLPVLETPGPHHVIAVAEDAAGNPGDACAAVEFFVDTTPPATPWNVLITSLTASGHVNTATPIITGQAEPDVHILISVDGRLAGETNANSSGAWTFTLTTPLSEGAHSVTARARDAAQRPSGDSAPRDFTVDTKRPAPPTVTVPAANSVIRTETPTLEGMAEPHAQVIVRIDGVALAPVVASETGAWSRSITSALPPGERVVVTTATDQATNVSEDAPAHRFTVDADEPADPTWTLPGPLDNALVSTLTPVLEGTADSDSEVTLHLDGHLLAVVKPNSSRVWRFPVPNPLPWTGAAISEGPTHNATALARDAAGNPSTTVTRTFRVDVTAPQTLLHNGPALVSSSTDGVFTVSSPDTTVTAFYCIRYESITGGTVVNEGPNGNCDDVGDVVVDPGDPTRFRVTLENFSIGNEHTVLISAVDPAGNKDPTPISHSWKVVDGELTTEILSKPDPVTGDTTARFIFGSGLPGAAFVGTLSGMRDGMPFTTPFDTGADVNTYTVENLQEGSYTLVVRARDPQTNEVSDDEETFAWIIDRGIPLPPSLMPDSPPEWVNTVLPNFRGTTPVSEEGGLVVLYVDGSAVGEGRVNTSGQWSITPSAPLSADPHRFYAKLTDRAGNESPQSIERQFNIDPDAPEVISMNGPGAGPGALLNDTQARFDIATDEDVTFECSLDNGVFTPCVQGHPLGASVSVSFTVGEGQHSLVVRVTDRATNVNAPLTTYPWRVDITDPETSFKLTPPVFNSSTEATFEFDAGGEVVTYECALDAEAFGDCTQRITRRGLSEGPHSLRVRARDEAGNLDEEPARFDWTVDTQGPVAPLLARPGADIPQGTQRPEFAGTAEPGSTVTVVVEGTEVGTATADGSGAWRVEANRDLPEGPRTVALQARDAAGNASPLSAEQAFFIDITPPDTTLVSTPEQRLRSTTASFSFSSEPGATFECSVDRLEFVECQAEFLVEKLEEGAHSLEVRAKDVAGNVDRSPASYSWRVYLGSDIRTRGGGLSCGVASGGGNASLSLLGLGGLVLLAVRRRRR
ncbi:adventurous gliding motility protein AgmC [Pyxidicoccus sp. 3LG]